jgi:hypothetical protein
MNDLPIFDDNYFKRKNDEIKEKEIKEEMSSSSALEQVDDYSNLMASGNLADYDFNNSYFADESNFIEIMTFYNWFLTTNEIPNDLRKEAIFYGGTVPYAVLANKFKNNFNMRVFGDVDIYVELKKFKQMRELITNLSNFKMIQDSADIFTFGQNQDKTKSFSNEVYNNVYNKEFGFKGRIEINIPLINEIKQHKVNVSLYPLYMEENDICSRGFRFGYNYKKRGNYLLETRLLRENFSLNDFVVPSTILVKPVNIVVPEWTIASKKSAMTDNYLHRKDKDKADLDFMNIYENELNIDKEKVKKMQYSMPSYAVRSAYKIENGVVKEVLDGEDYADAVKYDPRYDNS